MTSRQNFNNRVFCGGAFGIYKAKNMDFQSLNDSPMFADKLKCIPFVFGVCVQFVEFLFIVIISFTFCNTISCAERVKNRIVLI